MTSLLHAMKHTPDSYTENGALTFSTTYNSNLDFFALASAKRNDISGAVDLFFKAFVEDKDLAVKNLFYLRDIRGGSGERSIFFYCMRYLIQNYYNTRYRINKITHLVSLIPEYGRWKDIIDLIGLNPDLDMYICHIIKEQLDNDIANHDQGKSISLLSKWFPLNNCVKDIQRRKTAGYLCKKIFGGDYIKCRKTISSLRKSIIIEEKLSSKNYEDIKYSQVPSCAMKKYYKAFIRNDEERFNSFLEDVKAGKDKINTGTLFPHDIVHKAMEIDKSLNYAGHSEKRALESEIDTLDSLWNNLPDYNDCQNSICMVDISGSMFYGQPIPIEVSVSLGIYFAEHNSGKFRNHFITFSECPHLVEIKGENIVEKVNSVINDNNVGYNTNFESAFRFLLTAAKEHNLPQEEMPKRIYAISDMEFDAVSSRGKITNFGQIQRLYAEAGYEMPTLIFWNVASIGNNVPVSKDENGVILVSGFSPSVVGFITDGYTPEEFMLKVLRSKRYEPVVWQ